MEQSKLTELIERSRTGDPEAQAALIETAQRRVYYHCKKMLRHEQDAEDATQDVLMAILTKLDTLREPAAFWGWVNTLTANRCRHLLTAPHKEWQIPEDDEGSSMLDDLAELDAARIPAEALEDAETRRMVTALVDALPADQRMSCSEPDGAGYVTYTLSCETEFHFSLAFPDVREGGTFGYNSSYKLPDFCDAWSGMLLDAGYTNEGVDFLESAYLLEHNGKQFPVWVTNSVEKGEWGKDGPEGYRDVYHLSRTNLDVLTARVPADYDGLLLSYDGVTPRSSDWDPFAEEEEPEERELHFWNDENDSRENTVFIRITPELLAEFAAPETPEAEAAESA